MPRGRKKALAPEEQLEKLVSEIEETENKLKELKAKKKELEEAIKMNRVVELEEFISSRGLSIDEVKELLEKK
jgi:peptidoglycan hydrolase CwlO-like protein